VANISVDHSLEEVVSPLQRFLGEVLDDTDTVLLRAVPDGTLQMAPRSWINQRQRP
jgi:hypothetical protein